MKLVIGIMLMLTFSGFRAFSINKSKIDRANLLKSANLILDIPILLKDISEISQRYEIFLWDQFGVLHNGKISLSQSVQVLLVQYCEIT